MELQPHNSLEPAPSCSLASALAPGPPGRPIWVPVTRGLCEEMVRGLARSLAARPPCPGFCGAVAERAAKKWRPGGKQSCRTKQQMEDILWVSVGFRAGNRISWRAMESCSKTRRDSLWMGQACGRMSLLLSFVGTMLPGCCVRKWWSAAFHQGANAVSQRNSQPKETAC